MTPVGENKTNNIANFNKFIVRVSSMNATMRMGWLAAAALLSWVTVPVTQAQEPKKAMSCKLQSDKVKGKERMCLYVCEDKSLEGRTRKPESTCPSYINSTRS